MGKRLEPIPPGEILLEEYLKPMGITQEQLSRDLDTPKSKISEIIHGKRSITAITALRLAEYLGTEAEMWLKLQMIYDLQCAKQGNDWAVVKTRIRPRRVSVREAVESGRI